MRNLCLVPLLASLAAPPATCQLAGLEDALRARIGQDTAAVAMAYYDSVTRDTLLIDGLRRYHAASTMKIPVLIELARRVEADDFRWDQTITIRNSFRSIVDGSEYRLDPADDSDSTLYAELGHGVPIARLARLMIARSSNFATDLLITRLDPTRVNATAQAGPSNGG
jgi:beta-lactamase class A